MAKKGNVADSKSFTITLSMQSVQLLDGIARSGIYGRNRPEVAARFIDRALEAFIDQPKVSLPAIKLDPAEE